jgi:AraC-like DNA-binding protein
MSELLESMCDAAERHGTQPRQTTAVPGLVLHRIAESIPPTHTVYNPRILLILRGSKVVNLGEESLLAKAGTLLLVTVDVPVASQILMSHDGKSHLALALDINRTSLAKVLQKLTFKPTPTTTSAGLLSLPVYDELLDPFARLLKLLDQPDEIEFLYQLVLQEIYFRLFRSEVGDALAQFVTTGSHLSQINAATNWIRLHYSEPMSVDLLAGMVGMSVTSFHRHFKAITLMTPLQYRARIRLQQARWMLLSEGKNAGAVGMRVGYNSQSQFSRDYRRLFGAPPATDAAQLMGTQ